MIVRGGYRLIPWWLRRAVYRPLVALYGKRPGHRPAIAAQPEPAGRGHEQEWEHETPAAAFWRESAGA